MGGRRLGAGECAAIAYAACRGHFLAIDDKAARRAAAPVIPHARLLDTQAVMVSLIAAGVLSIDEADAIRDEWERQHRFALRIRSFRDAL